MCHAVGCCSSATLASARRAARRGGALSLSGDGWPTLRAVATPASRTTPFGAVAHAIPPDAIEPGTAIDPMRIFLALRGPAGSGGARRTAVMVDYIPFLDDATFTLITQLLSAGLAFVLCTARTGTPMPPGADSLVRAGSAEVPPRCRQRCGRSSQDPLSIGRRSSPPPYS
jgi:hypothetical protein